MPDIAAKVNLLIPSSLLLPGEQLRVRRVGEAGRAVQPAVRQNARLLGFPFFADTSKPKGYVKIYLKRMVKEIEDYQDYTLLRSKTISFAKTFILVLPPHFLRLKPY